ncbi:hypothetical protein [uncultured Desulfuromonas sp.]|uniref:hypothetical protein n=1 Tax=uncultured Desulfuromonas sp. TaxID=181013 RepID=UPI002AAB5FD7|nr:hypothetical protein [uncultured Desulfuromonas sp.]
MNLRCPVCHSQNSLEAYVSDEAGLELLVTLAETGPLFKPLVHYLGLFRSPTRALKNTRSLALVKEVLELEADPHQLAVAMHQTVEAIHNKRQAGDDRPLKNHNYLKQVLATVAITPPSTSQPVADPLGLNKLKTSSKRAHAIHALTKWMEETDFNWLRLCIGSGFATLIGLCREGAPAADTITITAGLWEAYLIDKKVTIAEVDSHRIEEAFKRLLNETDKWPEPKDLYARLPRRPERDQINHDLSDDDREKGKEFFRNMQK